jgi:outer membrane protein assembly factor BamB
MTTLFTCISVTEAYFPDVKRETLASLAVVPSTIGLGQTVLFNGWITPPPDLDQNYQPIKYENIYVTVSTPNAGTETLGPLTSDGPGSIWTTFTPDQIGEYSAILSWDGVSPAIYSDRRYLAESPRTTFTVQSEPLPPAFEDQPLPDYYWTRPINSEFRSWAGISGGWYDAGWCQRNGSDSCYNPYSTAPSSAHITWKKNTRASGIMGGELEGRFISSSAPQPVVAAGRAIYSDPNGIHCVDVKTGEEYWVTSGGGALCMQPNIGGPTLWTIRGGSTITITKYNVNTGATIGTFTGPGLGTRVYGGIQILSPTEMYYYFTNHDMVDETETYKIDLFGRGETIEDITVWKTYVHNLDHFPTVSGDTFVQQWGPAHSMYALDTETGALKWNVTLSSMAETRGSTGYGKSFGTFADRTVKAYNLETGALEWESEQFDYPWGQFFSYAIGVAYDRIYVTCYDGHVYCLNAHTGATEWKYYSGDTTETPYGTWAFYGKPAVADGKVYAGTTEHSPTNPFLRGFRLHCLDAIQGNLIWSIAGSYGAMSIADGVLLAPNGYTSQLYAFSKGQTSTTVSASPKIVTKGSSVIIEGSVMDLSPAQPNTPAISDEDMSEWMEYLHMQYPMPTDATGVGVKLTAVDSDGDTHDLGYATSDMSGYFSKMWTPPDEGHYTVMATFEGTNSYYPSYAVGAVGVDPAPATDGPIEPEPTPEPEAPLISTEVAIIAAVAVVAVIGIVAYWALRKRK